MERSERASASSTWHDDAWAQGVEQRAPRGPRGVGCLPMVGHDIPYPIQKLQELDNSTPKLQLKLHFLSSISLKPIHYLINQFHRCVELQGYSNFG
jgi:hypothetical protein